MVCPFTHSDLSRTSDDDLKTEAEAEAIVSQTHTLTHSLTHTLQYILSPIATSLPHKTFTDFSVFITVK
jgi:hypothetical protein